jgi:DNA-3-methyladenine glycosylase I
MKVYSKTEDQKRCKWVDLNNPLYVKYHDIVWGVPVHNDRLLFEMLVLEGAQAGLSWSTILAKREHYKKAFDNFNVKKVASYGEEKVDELLLDQGIIRNKLKISSAVKNAKVFLMVQEEFGSFNNYLWGFVAGKVIQNQFEKFSDIPAQTDLSLKISKDLKKRGMNFVGPTIIYAFMQAVGIVNDHEKHCFRHRELS